MRFPLYPILQIPSSQSSLAFYNTIITQNFIKDLKYLQRDSHRLVMLQSATIEVETEEV